MGGFWYHFLLTLRLNFRSKQPLIYGYLVPVFFLIAFGTVFRSGVPPLVGQMSQLITISALGGACFGLPTAMVAERERGWWRRYRLLPRAVAPLLGSTLLARLVLVAVAAALQLVLARVIYGTPFPIFPGHFALAYLAVVFAFLGLGLLIAGLASDVPAVQALGQCVFLPLIMIGGVGIPLVVLPDWAQRLASFLPGRYAVDALQAGYTDEAHGALFGFNLLALVAFGIAAGLAGARIFRWDPAARLARSAGVWIVLTLAPWLAVGAISLQKDHWHALDTGGAGSAASITEDEIRTLRFSSLPPDDGIVTPLARPLVLLQSTDRARLDDLRKQLDGWSPGHLPDWAQSIRNLLCVAAAADVAEDRDEAAIARLVLDYLYQHYRQDRLQQALAWVALNPAGGTVFTTLPDLGLKGQFDEATIRLRDQIYAEKFLGRLRGQIPN